MHKGAAQRCCTERGGAEIVDQCGLRGGKRPEQQGGKAEQSAGSAGRVSRQGQPAEGLDPSESSNHRGLLLEN